MDETHWARKRVALAVVGLVAVAGLATGALALTDHTGAGRAQVAVRPTADPAAPSSTAASTTTTTCQPLPPGAQRLTGSKCLPSPVHHYGSPPNLTSPPIAPGQVVTHEAPPPLTTPVPVAPCPPGSGSSSVTIALSGSPARFDRHCYYTSSGTATVTVEDRSIDPDTGYFDPTLVSVSAASAPAFGAPPGKPDAIIDDPSKDLAQSPYAVDTTPVTFTLPHLPPGTYDLNAAQIPGEPIAVLTVTGGR